MNRLLPIFLLMTACSAELDGVRVLGPESVEVSWDDAYDGLYDGMIAAVPVDLLAHSVDGTALPGELLSLSVEGASLALPEDLLEQGTLWDAVAWREIEILASGPRLEIHADDMGAVRVVVLIDHFGLQGDCFEPVELVVDGAGEDLTIPIAPRMPCR